MTATSHPLDATQEAAINELRTHVSRMNDAVKRAVDSGLIIEIKRASRHHDSMCYGDQMSPQVMGVRES